MLADGNPTFDKVAQELYKSNGDEMTRYACQMREEYEFQMRRIDKRIEEAETANEHLKGEVTSLKSENTSLKDEINRLRQELEQSKMTDQGHCCDSPPNAAKDDKTQSPAHCHQNTDHAYGCGPWHCR